MKYLAILTLLLTSFFLTSCTEEAAFIQIEETNIETSIEPNSESSHEKFSSETQAPMTRGGGNGNGSGG